MSYKTGNGERKDCDPGGGNLATERQQNLTRQRDQVAQQKAINMYLRQESQESPQSPMRNDLSQSISVEFREQTPSHHIQ